MEKHPSGIRFHQNYEHRLCGDLDKVVEETIGSTEGFTLVLAGLKALLEHGVRLNLTADRYPKGIEDQVIGG